MEKHCIRKNNAQEGTTLGGILFKTGRKGQKGISAGKSGGEMEDSTLLRVSYS